VRARDRPWLYAAAFLRATATGLLGVLLGLDLAARGFDAAETGLVVGVGLAGAAAAVLIATVAGARLGERRLLVMLTVAGGAGALVASVATHPWLVVVAAFVGGMNGVGRDRGAQLVLEQAMLPSTTADADRTRAFAWYSLLQDAGHALGALGAGVAAGRSIEAYAVLLLASGACYAGLSSRAAGAGPVDGEAVSAHGRRVIRRLSALFFVDSFAGGFIPGALLAVFFHSRFGVGAESLGALFFGARVANAASHLVAAWLARRIGLVRTMVFTHVPSSLLLLTVAWAPTFPIAAALFLLREGLVEMDVPTRQSYVMAVVRPAERTLASGATNLVRLAGWGAGALVAGVAMQHAGATVPLAIAAALKLAYDALLYRAFRRERPPEERD
jgi:MFS family permease